MLRHVFHPHTPWGLPGGWLARDESPAECAHRELWEETGLTANLGPVIHLSREPKPPHLGIVFLAKIVPGQVKLSTEILEATWFESDSLPSPLLPFVEEAIVKAKDFTVQSLME